MLRRKIETELKNWLVTKYALMVYGARQVGKTFTLQHFLEDNFDSVYYLNLHENPSAIKTILGATDAKDFLLRLTAIPGTEDLTEESCIFIDEIQEYYTYIERHKEIETYYDLISQSKYITQESNHRLVFSGSLLRLELNNLITNPMGYLLPLEMYPLDFEEFLWAAGVNTQLIDIAENCFITHTSVPDYIHERFMDIFRKYILIGGMPQAVWEFVEKNSFKAVETAHKAIEYYIAEDITKYAEDSDRLKIKEIYNLIPTELANPSRKFVMSHIPGHKKNDNEVLSFTWLNNAGITIPVYISSEPVIPLKISSARNQLKLFHEDVGILTYLMFGYEVKSRILAGEIVPNFGAVYENAVAQNLFSHGFVDLYYYNSKKYGEVDFLLEKDGLVLPVEVKSGKGYTHRALNNIMDIENFRLDKALCFYNENVKTEGKVTYLPIYMCTFLKKR